MRKQKPADPLVAEALEIWLKLSGVRLGEDGSLAGGSEVFETGRILEAKRPDAQLGLLEAAVRQYLGRREISLLDALEGRWQGSAEALAALAFFARPEVAERTASIEHWAAGALEHYKLKPEVFSREELWGVFADAEEMVAGMQAHRVGPVDEGAGGPQQAAGWLYITRDLEQLVEQADNLPQGVMLVLVETKERLHSYFLFLVHDGRRLVAFSDEEDWRHPLEHAMTRRPDRRLERRADRGGLPYQLVAPQMYDWGQPSSEKALARSGTRQFHRLSELPVGQALFILLCYDGLRVRYSQMGSSERSYVVAKAPVALTAGQTALALRPAELEVAAPDLRSLVDKPQAADIESHGINAAAVDAYLAAGREPESKALALHKSALAKLTPGLRTESRLRADAAWLGRERLAREVSGWVGKRHPKEVREVGEWLQDAVWANRERLLAWVGKPVEYSRLEVKQFAVDKPFRRRLWEREPGQVGWRVLGDLGVMFTDREAVLANRGGWQHLEVRCAVTGVHAIAETLSFEPRCAADLAFLLGVELKEVPALLRERWQTEIDYIGNSILDRLDPLDWAIDDPWKEKSISIVAFLSKRGLAKLGATPLPPEAKSKA